MRRSNRPRSIALPRRSDDVQPTAILGALGMIAALLVSWAGIVGALPGLQ